MSIHPDPAPANSDRPAGGAADAAALSPLKRAFLALEKAQARLAAHERAAHAPIAVVGLACRVPGADDAKAFWQLMKDGVDAIGRVPADRWDADALYDADPDAPGKIATREGGFLGSVDRFDAAFFGIAPREAQGMDPQQRLMLEVAWEALESASQAPERLQNTPTGVYFGVTASDYATMQLGTHRPELLDAHFTSGIAHSIMSGRLSYLLGLQGPSLTIDTACSSSLVAVHLACQSLRSGETSLALAGGVNLILSPDLYIALSHSRMLAPDGRCKTFDAAADGFARGEGCGVVVLKRLADAEAQGDRILAVIRGSAVNQDGPSSSLTAPNGPAQAAVIRRALADAGIPPSTVGYIEAHGTGTQLGDPLEVQALADVFAPSRDAASPLVLGSVKTNIGHLEGAAGVVGLIKAVLALGHRTIPRHLHLVQPSPHIAWERMPFDLPRETRDWPAIAGRRVAGVSSFGFSGTNAHVVVEEWPESAAQAEAAPGGAPRMHVMALSARTDAALAALAARYLRHLSDEPRLELADICRTANAGRSHFAVRAALAARSTEELKTQLQALAAGGTAPGLRRAASGSRSALGPGRDPLRIAFMYTGQGAQYAGMSRGLYDTFPVFREALDRCAALLAPVLRQPLLEVLYPAEGQASPIDETAWTQPALFAVEYALTELWKSVGVVPQAVMGHSLGEIVAACVAGVFSLPEALRLVADRARLMQSLPGGGAMAAVMAPLERVEALLAGASAGVSIAAINGPAQTVVSGSSAAVDALCKALEGEGVACRRLPVSHAFHSSLVEPILDEFEKAASAVAFASPQLRLFSNVTGRSAVAAEITQPAYWRRHLRGTVRFADGLAALAEWKPDAVIEVGPQASLLAFAAEAFGASDSAPHPALIPSQRRGHDDRALWLDALVTLYLAGARIEWQALSHGARIVELPSYPFERERHWFPAVAAAPKSSAPHVARGRPTGHPLLGTRLRSAAEAIVFESHVAPGSPSFVRQHKVQGHVVLPATAYLDVLAAAADSLHGSGAGCITGIAIKTAMLFTGDEETRTLQTVCTHRPDGSTQIVIASLADDAGEDEPWTEHVSAELEGPRARAADREEIDPPRAPTLDEAREACRESVSPGDFYAGFEARGLDFGPGFRVLRRLWRGEGQALAEVSLDTALAADAAGWGLHPALLDGCLQVLALALPTEDLSLFLPIGIGRYSLAQRVAGPCFSHVTLREAAGDIRRADIRVMDAGGAIVATLHDVQLKRVGRDALGRLGDRWVDDKLYETRWKSSALPSTAKDLAARVAPAADRLAEAAGLSAYDCFVPRFEAACADYVVQTMTRLGWRPAVGETIDEAALADRLKVAPAHRRLFARLLSILAETHWITAAHEGPVRVARAFADVHPADTLARLRAEFPQALAEIELTERVAESLADALRGEREPMELLFPAGSLDTAERMYRDAPTARFFNGLAAEAIEQAVAERLAANPSQPVRILEVGGGTGGTTAHVLPRLPHTGVHYTFTDVGSLFVARAQERFGRPSMSFRTLDLDADLKPQGFDAESYDIVIGANCVHAASDLRRTLAGLRELLAPNGLLAMVEVTAPQRWYDLTVGLTSGWWAFTDTDLRPDYPTLSRPAWLALLAESGYGSAAALPADAAQPLHGVRSLQSLILARKSAEAGASAGRRWLALADQAGLMEAAAAALRARGDHCTLVRAGSSYGVNRDDPGEALIDPASAADYRRLLGDIGPVHGALHAWTLDAPSWTLAGDDTLDRSRLLGPVSATLLAQALVAQADAPRLWLVGSRSQQVDATDRLLEPARGAIWGLGKALALAHPELRTVCIDADVATDGRIDSSSVDALLAELDQSGAEAQVALRPGGRKVARLAPVRNGNASRPRPASWTLAPTTAGAFDGFHLAPSTRRQPRFGEVEIAVEATGLNFRDVLNVLGLYPGEAPALGSECAGKVVAVGEGVTHLAVGDDVLAVAGGSFASHVIARAAFTQKRPAGMSAHEGATFPVAFMTAAFCLQHVAGLERGERVLIHAAAGGVGMAAVQIALRAGAEVHATAGAPWKRELLRSLGVQHVYDSRTDAFAAAIREATLGHGVDVVLNSLTGPLIDASFAVLARGGRFVEIGKRGIKDKAWVAAQGHDHRYHVIDWGETGERDPQLIGGLLAALVDDVAEGRLVPLPRHAFELEDAGAAFRLMAEGRHAGRVVVQHGAASMPDIRRDGTYLVTGGLSGLGPVIARWLAERGAGRLALIGRRGITAESEPLVNELRERGIDVVAEALDVSDDDAIRALLERLRRTGPALRGVIHSAGVLADAALAQQDAERFARVFSPKVKGAWLLERKTRGDPLDFFVLFSSIAATLGSAGQANHSAANACLDLLARQRASLGLPALSVGWGVWSDTGAAVTHGVTSRLGQTGLGTMTPAQGLAALERLLGTSTRRPAVAVLPIDWPLYVARTTNGAAPAFLSEIAALSATRRDAAVLSTDAASAHAPAQQNAASPEAGLLERIAEVPDSRKRSVVASFVRQCAVTTLGLDASRAIEPRTPLAELGLDSLLAVELRNRLGRSLGRTFPASLLFDHPTLEALTAFLMAKVLAATEQPSPTQTRQPPSTRGGVVDAIEELSDSEVERRLAARLQSGRR